MESPATSIITSVSVDSFDNLESMMILSHTIFFDGCSVRRPRRKLSFRPCFPFCVPNVFVCSQLAASQMSVNRKCVRSG